MDYEKFPIVPLPPEANQFCPHCGEQAFMTHYQNIPDGIDVPVITCVNHHVFAMNVPDEATVIENWNLRV